MPWPLFLVLPNGANSVVADEFRRHAGTPVDDVDQHAQSFDAQRHLHRMLRRRGLDGVVQQMPDDGIEGVRVDRRAGAGAVIAEIDRPAMDRLLRVQQRAQPLRRRDQRMIAFLPFDLQARQQPGDLADRGTHRGQHVALEVRIVGVALGVGQEHR